MGGVAARFCTACGGSFPESARFCPRCGAARGATGPGNGATGVTTGVVAPAPGAGGIPGQAATTSVGGAFRTAQTAASYAGMAAGMPWQTVVAGERPDLGAFLKQAGMPVGTTIARRVIQRSVRKPALALLFTTLLDALVTVISGQPAALSALGMRVLSGSLTGFVGLIVGKRQGRFGRGLLAVGSVVTAALQLYNAGSMLLAAVTAQSGFLSLLPGLISTASVIVVATKTLLMAVRRAKQPSAGAVQPS